MNRQIKFRAKILNSDQWIYGYYYYNVPTREHRIISPVEKSDEMIGWNIDSSTIGQFTGLTDKNGKEIYEGDILRDSEFTYAVYWYDDIAAFMFEEYKSECDAPKIWLLSDFCKECEVIGNIYDDKIKEE